MTGNLALAGSTIFSTGYIHRPSILNNTLIMNNAIEYGQNNV